MADIIDNREEQLADPESPDVPRLEAEIDDLVYDLYGLTDTERELVLSATKNAQNRNTREE